MHFAANCGNIIRRYCFAAEYALVAQPVEHLTFNQRARDSSSLERTKIPRRIVRFLVGFFVFWGSARFLHTGGKAVFFIALSAFCASWRNLSGQSPSICCRRPFCRLKAPLGLSLLRCACKRELCSANCCFNVPLLSCLAIKKALPLNALH